MPLINDWMERCSTALWVWRVFWVVDTTERATRILALDTPLGLFERL